MNTLPYTFQSFVNASEASLVHFRFSSPVFQLSPYEAKNPPVPPLVCVRANVAIRVPQGRLVWMTSDQSELEAISSPSAYIVPWLSGVQDKTSCVVPVCTQI